MAIGSRKFASPECFSERIELLSGSCVYTGVDQFESGESEDAMSAAEVRLIEYEVADELVRSIEPGVKAVSVQGDGETIRIRLQGANGWKLDRLVFSREGLRRLDADPDRNIKVEYLRRDILRSGPTRREYRYPRTLWTMF